MSWDFSTEPEFEDQRQWIAGFVRDSVEPLDLLYADRIYQPLQPPYDVVVANLTAWLLERSASRLLAAVAPRGILILSGLQTTERDAVADAFPSTEVVWECEEQSWVALAMKKL